MDSRVGDAESTPRPSGSEWVGNAVTTVIVVAFFGYLVYRRADFGAVALVACGLGLLIFIHELGHFLAAKWCDVYVETFSVGFGPALPYCSFVRGETLYKLAVFPLGGYVKMLGEGSDNEEGEDDPRSFKNKTVGQRMLIISAGVIMNLLLAVAAFIGVYMTTGVERTAGVIGTVNSGSPAWTQGLRSGAKLLQIGSRTDPFFDDVRPVVVLATPGTPVPVRFTMSDQPDKVLEADIQPAYDKDTQGMQLIGVAAANVPVLRESIDVPPLIAVPDSPADRLGDQLRGGDRIVATTDPANPGQLAPLPPDPRNPSRDRRDFFAWHRRLIDLAGKPMTVRIARADGTTADVTVPPAFHRALGVVMRAGPVAAVRVNSPVAGRVQAGDKIKQIEVARPDGGKLRFVTAKGVAVPEVEERPLDPDRLPFELRQWADAATGAKRVKLTVLRPVGHDERQELEVTADWDESWKYAIEGPFDRNAPRSIPELGLAYHVETSVEEVVPGSAADKAGVKAGDVVQGIQGFMRLDGRLQSWREGWVELKPTQWAYFWTVVQERSSPEKLNLKLKRPGEAKAVEVTLTDLPDDPTWPRHERGFLFEPDIRLQQASGPIDAIGIGVRRTWETTVNIAASLKALAAGRISFLKNASGPIGIASSAYMVASESPARFILTLAMLSVNLAVINFLPIPVLDGGHMVFLLYEKLIGRPAPESVRVAATFAGLAMIAGLFLCVTFLDVMRTWF